MRPFILSRISGRTPFIVWVPLRETLGQRNQHCRSIFSLHAVTERMAAPGCGSGSVGRRETVVHSHFHVMASEIGATQAACLS